VPIANKFGSQSQSLHLIPRRRCPMVVLCCVSFFRYKASQASILTLLPRAHLIVQSEECRKTHRKAGHKANYSTHPTVRQSFRIPKREGMVEKNSSSDKRPSYYDSLLFARRPGFDKSSVESPRHARIGSVSAPRVRVFLFSVDEKSRPVDGAHRS